MAEAQIKIEVVGDDVEALATTLVALAAKVSQQTAGEPVSVDMPLDELLSVVRAKAAAEGFKLLVVRADADRDDDRAQDAQAAAQAPYEPKAVKRRGRRTKAEMEAARAAEAVSAEDVVEDADGPTAEATVVWENPTTEEEPPAEMSEAEMESLKRATMKKLLEIHKTAGGPEKVDAVLAEYKAMGFSAAVSIPPRHYVDIAKRLEQ